MQKGRLEDFVKSALEEMDGLTVTEVSIQEMSGNRGFATPGNAARITVTILGTWKGGGPALEVSSQPRLAPGRGRNQLTEGTNDD